MFIDFTHFLFRPGHRCSSFLPVRLSRNDGAHHFGEACARQVVAASRECHLCRAPVRSVVKIDDAEHGHALGVTKPARLRHVTGVYCGPALACFYNTVGLCFFSYAVV